MIPRDRSLNTTLSKKMLDGTPPKNPMKLTTLKFNQIIGPQSIKNANKLKNHYVPQKLFGELITEEERVIFGQTTFEDPFNENRVRNSVEMQTQVRVKESHELTFT